MDNLTRAEGEHTMTTTPDFVALRAERNAKRRAFEAKMRSEGYTMMGGGCSLGADDACYCACPDGPCEHDNKGDPYESEDGCAWSTTCSRCGSVSMYHDMRVMP